MKRTLLLITASIFSLTAQLSAQCTPNATYTVPGFYPATGFPSGFVTVPFSQTVQVRVLTDTTSSSAPGVIFTVNYVQMDSVVGMPTGFSYTSNPSSGKFPGASNGCLSVTGVPVAGQELAGPHSNGVYPLTVYYHANVSGSIGGIPITTNQSGTNTKYTVTILPQSAGIAESELGEVSLSQNIPNPAGSSTDISYWIPNADNVAFTVYNVLGSQITNRVMHAERGANKFTYDTSSLSPGIYLYSIKIGSNTVSRRMIVAAH